MPNTSATGGYLAQLRAFGFDDEIVFGGFEAGIWDGRDVILPLSMIELEDIWHDVIAGITRIDDTLVRPSRQVDPVKQPAHGIDWCAFEITRVASDPWPYVRHDSAGDGSDIVVDHDVYRLAAAFYGPSADMAVGVFRRGLCVWQNRAALRGVAIAVRSVGDPITVPELDSMSWRQRVDIDIVFIVESKARYAVLNLLRSTGTITGNDGTAVSYDTEEVKPHG